MNTDAHGAADQPSNMFRTDIAAYGSPEAAV
jgi:hypothetical protein